MLKILAVFAVLLIFVIPGVWAEVYIENDYQYVSNDNTIHIVGEIINDSNTPLNQVTISAIIYSGENVIHEANTDTLTNLIMPGMKAVFDLQITENIGTVNNYLLDVDYKVAYPKNQVIEITSSEMKYGPSQNLIIQGTVANHGDATANMINVIATLYDKDGNIVGVSKTSTEPDYLRSNDESVFVIAILDGSESHEIVNYSLTAESEEYTAVPEFPFTSGALLMVSLSAYIILTKTPFQRTINYYKSHIFHNKW